MRWHQIGVALIGIGSTGNVLSCQGPLHEKGTKIVHLHTVSSISWNKIVCLEPEVCYRQLNYCPSGSKLKIFPESKVQGHPINLFYTLKCQSSTGNVRNWLLSFGGQWNSQIFPSLTVFLAMTCKRGSLFPSSSQITKIARKPINAPWCTQCELEGILLWFWCYRTPWLRGRSRGNHGLEGYTHQGCGGGRRWRYRCLGLLP